MLTFPVSPKKDKALSDRMIKLGVKESDLSENFIRSSGPGGQKVNKTSSCVQLTHTPSGIEVKCQTSRSQALNRYHARELLCDALESKIEGVKSAHEQERERIRRQKRKRSKRAKDKMLQDKHHHSGVKDNRGNRDWSKD